MFAAMSAERAFLRQFRRENGWRGYLEYRAKRLLGSAEPMTLWHRGRRLRLRATGPWEYSVATHCAADLEQVPVLTISCLMDLVGNDDLLIFKMNIEGAEAALLTPQADWRARTGVLMVELHERITPGCEQAFFAANDGRCVLRAGGERFLSIGPGYFAKRVLSRVA